MNISVKLIPARASRARRVPRLFLPVQPVNTDVVRAFMRECMAPILAKEFLRLREAAPSVGVSAKDENQTSQPFGKEDGL